MEEIIQKINQELPWGYEIERTSDGTLRLRIYDPDFSDNPSCTCAQRAAEILRRHLGDYDMSFNFG